jgi:hypothetical protein
MGELGKSLLSRKREGSENAKRTDSLEGIQENMDPSPGFLIASFGFRVFAPFALSR